MKKIITQIPEIELVYRPKFDPEKCPRVKDSQQAYNLFLHNWNMDKIGLVIEFKVMLLNSSNRALGIVNITTGGISSATVDLRLIYAAALKAGAGYIIIAHNHPSGSTKPSKADIQLNRAIKAGAKLLGITVFDSLIISQKSYCSY